jgi:hypothetical protein
MGGAREEKRGGSVKAHGGIAAFGRGAGASDYAARRKALVRAPFPHPLLPARALELVVGRCHAPLEAPTGALVPMRLELSQSLPMPAGVHEYSLERVDR